MTLTRREIGELLQRHGLVPSRALGQNFVVDPNTVRRIVRLAGVAPGDHVVEVGAGLGSLTVALAEAGAHVTAVEIDRHLVPALREVVSPYDVDIVEGDALALHWADVLARTARWHLVANLPYNVATPLVIDLLDRVPRIDTMLVMIQREVGERLAAAPGTKAYGVPSVRVAYWATAELVGQVPPSVFLPRPRVESVLVRINRRAEPAVDSDRNRLFELVRAGFGQRRKMLRRSLGRLVSADAFERAGIRPESRAEELSIEDWGRLADAAAETEPEGA
jgi:16S rRNA (adenine1518-N6/adenine1519-N6)-dimethyltransferase